MENLHESKILRSGLKENNRLRHVLVNHLLLSSNLLNPKNKRSFLEALGSNFRGRAQELSLFKNHKSSPTKLVSKYEFKYMMRTILHKGSNTGVTCVEGQNLFTGQASLSRINNPYATSYNDKVSYSSRDNMFRVYSKDVMQDNGLYTIETKQINYHPDGFYTIEAKIVTGAIANTLRKNVSNLKPQNVIVPPGSTTRGYLCLIYEKTLPCELSEVSKILSRNNSSPQAVRLSHVAGSKLHLPEYAHFVHGERLHTFSYSSHHPVSLRLNPLPSQGYLVFVASRVCRTIDVYGATTIQIEGNVFQVANRATNALVKATYPKVFQCQPQDVNVLLQKYI
jgi:hypothetical protein